MTKSAYLLLFHFFVLSVAMSQTVIHGRIIDKVTREPLEQAYIRVLHTGEATASNKLGFFIIKSSSRALQDSIVLSASFIGYKPAHVKAGEQPLLIEMEKGPVNLQEVIITTQSNSTAFHTISRIDLNLQPVKSAQDMLRMVPGLFIGQHQGGGKAEQIFLRGFDADHGTDINVSVDGLPVNMVSHAHGQGYADLHFIIPELTANIDYGKGPYYTPFGNLGTAGYVSFTTVNSLDKNIIKLEGGQFNTFRALTMVDLLSGKQKEKGTNAYIASELLYSDGPFDLPQHFNRFNFFGKYNTRVGRISRLTLTASTLSSDWNASGQIPERAVKGGHISRFGAIDSLEGGYTTRTNAIASLSMAPGSNDLWENQLYYTNYHFSLHSDFTFFLHDPIHGDQIRQREARNIVGYQSRFTHESNADDWKLTSHYGAGFRLDATHHTELSHTINRNIVLEYKQLGNIDELNAFGYADKSFARGPWLISLGTRLDHFRFHYTDLLHADQARDQQQLIVSPKVNLQYTFNRYAQLYIKAGKGFHSNDTRVAVFNRGNDILPAAYGADIGMVLKPFPRMFIDVAAWYLYLQQEFIYVGDEGIVEPAGKTRRTGIDVSARYQLTGWLFADMNVNMARPRSINAAKGENYIPLAPTLTSTGGLNWRTADRWNGSIRYRYMKDRPANATNTIIARGYTVADLSVNYTKKKYECGITIENLFNTRWKETQFNTLSRLKDEPAPVEEIHFTPGVPFFARLKAAIFF